MFDELSLNFHHIRKDLKIFWRLEEETPREQLKEDAAQGPNVCSLGGTNLGALFKAMMWICVDIENFNLNQLTSGRLNMFG